ncbi:MAG TPA: hypothetical protein VER96_26950 [Polyangiaceae bacterium]|nr:hypothetical protein [Polyangiaceae bacterium]
MRARLQGLDEIAWHRTHPNNASGADLPRLIRSVAAGNVHKFKLWDALLHQGTRFGGAAEALPFLIELASADETPERPALVWLAAGVGAPVEEEARLRRLLCRGGELGWHGALALGCLAEHRALSQESVDQLAELLEHAVLVQRVAAACALAFARSSDERVFDVLASTDEHFAELSRMRCRFEQPLMGMVARACALMGE